MSRHLKIVIAHSSAILRSGLEVTLKQLSGYHIRTITVDAVDKVVDTLRLHRPDLLIINPALPGYVGLQTLRNEAEETLKCVALVYAATDPQLLRLYDEQIGVYDSSDEIRHKLDRLFAEAPPELREEAEEAQTLSAREKEIVVGVVKGMTNREIADLLFLSTHTVITHRRNIARKLQIHSPSGLTIYAIVNKLVALKDIQ